MKVDILAFAAHPDDVEYGAGGFLLKAKEQGLSTAIIDLTLGDKSTHGSVKERLKEADSASKILELNERENLKIPDNHVNPYDENQIVQVVRVIRNFKPTYILAPYFHDLHPDHAHCGQLVEKAAFFSKVKNHHKNITDEPHKVSYVLYYQLHTDFLPSFIIDISTTIDKKIDAIYAHKSQFFYEHNGILSPRNPELENAIRHKASVYGKKIATQYGEPFYTKSYIGFSNIPTFISGSPKE